MTLNIEIAPDMEQLLRKLAARNGVEPGQYAADALRAYLAEKVSDRNCSPPHESHLLEQINTGLSQAEWHRYYELVDKRRSEQISPAEYAELSATTNRLEELNAKRIATLANLAELRKVTLNQIMQDLGISPPGVI